MNSFSSFVVFSASKSGTTWLQKLTATHLEGRRHFQALINAGFEEDDNW